MTAALARGTAPPFPSVAPFRTPSHRIPASKDLPAWCSLRAFPTANYHWVQSFTSFDNMCGISSCDKSGTLIRKEWQVKTCKSHSWRIFFCFIQVTPIGVRHPAWATDYFLLWGTPKLIFNDYRSGSFSGGKSVKIWRWPLTSTFIEDNLWRHTPTPLYAFMACT
jgi:hypothetical protein